MRRRRRQESGYALLLILLMGAILAITLYTEIPRVAFESQRQKEQMLIDRGEQYKRAIQLFYRKNNRYPTKIEDLENTNNIRFLRHRYKDPMTGKDEWRPIHVTNGVLTDSKVQQQKNQDTKNKDGYKYNETSLGAVAGLGQTLSNAPGASTVNPGLRRRGSDNVTVGPPGATGNPGADPNAPGAVAGVAGVPGQTPLPGQPGYTGQPLPGQPGYTGQPLPGQPGYPGQPVNGQPLPGQPGYTGQPVQGQTGLRGGVATQPGMPPGSLPGQIVPGGRGAVPGMPGSTPPGGSTTTAGNSGSSFGGGSSLGGGGSSLGGFSSSGNSGPQQPVGVPGGLIGGNIGAGGVVPPNGVYPPGTPVNSQTGGVAPVYGVSPGSNGVPPSYPQPGAAINPQAQSAAAQMIGQILTQPRPGGMPLTNTQGAAAMGSGIAGFASTLDQDSIMVYNDQTNYSLWEFIFDPAKQKQVMNVGGGTPGTPASQIGSQIGTPATQVGQPAGTSPFGQPAGASPFGGTFGQPAQQTPQGGRQQ